jgi:SPOR domain
MKIDFLSMRLTGIIFISAVLITAALPAFAQDSLATIHCGPSTIHEDAQIAGLMNQYKDYNRRKEFTDGYRIQLMYTDVRDEVYKSKSKTYGEFPDLPSYVEYEQPYYKLRIGDFSTRLEATYYLQKVIAIYSGAFIVKDKIRVK